MPAYNRENFRRIYLLSGTAPEIYGTGHAQRAVLLREILSRCDLRLLPITEPPDRYWNGQGKPLLAEIAASPIPVIVILDARDLDPSPLLTHCSVLALDNQSQHRKNLQWRPSASCSAETDSSEPDRTESDPAERHSSDPDSTATPRSESGAPATDNSAARSVSREVPTFRRKVQSLYLPADGFPIIYYDTLLPGCDLKTSVRRYLGPATPSVPLKNDARRITAGQGRPQNKDLVFYAGSVGFIPDSILDALDAVLQSVFGDLYIRIGGREPAARINYHARLEGVAYAGLLNEAEFFLGYYGLSLYQAAAAGCAVWGLMPGHRYHDELICQWSIQGGGPVLRTGPQMDLPLISGTTRLSQRKAVGGPALEGEGEANLVPATEVRIQTLRQSGAGWKESGDLSSIGSFAFRAALRALKRAERLVPSFERPGQ